MELFIFALNHFFLLHQALIFDLVKLFRLMKFLIYTLLNLFEIWRSTRQIADYTLIFESIFLWALYFINWWLSIKVLLLLWAPLNNLALLILLNKWLRGPKLVIFFVHYIHISHVKWLWLCLMAPNTLSVSTYYFITSLWFIIS